LWPATWDWVGGGGARVRYSIEFGGKTKLIGWKVAEPTANGVALRESRSSGVLDIRWVLCG
jgi:hypothetical protein